MWQCRPSTRRRGEPGWPAAQPERRPRCPTRRGAAPSPRRGATASLAAPPCRFASARKLLRDTFGAALADAPPHTLLLWLALALDYKDSRSEAQSLILTLLDTRQPAADNSSSSGVGGGGGSSSKSSGSGTAAAQGTNLRLAPSRGVLHAGNTRLGLPTNRHLAAPHCWQSSSSAPRLCPIPPSPAGKGWSRRQYLALVHLYAFEVLLPELKDPSGE